MSDESPFEPERNPDVRAPWDREHAEREGGRDQVKVDTARLAKVGTARGANRRRRR
jgi:hypothetical protein